MKNLETLGALADRLRRWADASFTGPVEPGLADVAGTRHVGYLPGNGGEVSGHLLRIREDGSAVRIMYSFNLHGRHDVVVEEW